MKPKESANQLTFAVFCPPVVTSNGDGSMCVKPGRPIIRLTPTQLGAHFGVNRDTIYRWRQEGIIPADQVTFAGRRKLLFACQLIPVLEAKFRSIRE